MNSQRGCEDKKRQRIVGEAKHQHFQSENHLKLWRRACIQTHFQPILKWTAKKHLNKCSLNSFCFDNALHNHINHYFTSTTLSVHCVQGCQALVKESKCDKEVSCASCILSVSLGCLLKGKHYGRVIGMFVQLCLSPVVCVNMDQEHSINVCIHAYRLYICKHKYTLHITSLKLSYIGMMLSLKMLPKHMHKQIKINSTYKRRYDMLFSWKERKGQNSGMIFFLSGTNQPKCVLSTEY